MEDRNFIDGLLGKHANAFIEFTIKQNSAEFVDTPNNKWSVGQNLDHLIKSLSPVNLALRFPKFLLRWLFGKPNRAPRSYQQLIDRYHDKLNKGGKASARFIPPQVTWSQKDTLLNKFQNETQKMSKAIHLWSEDDLDKYLLPHPLLGKLTIREMLFFSAYHINHHLLLLEGRKKG